MGQSRCLLCVPGEDAFGEGAENLCTFFPCMTKPWGRRFDLHSHFSFMLLEQHGANGEAAVINSRRGYCGDGWGRGDQVGGKGAGGCLGAPAARMREHLWQRGAAAAAPTEAITGVLCACKPLCCASPPAACVKITGTGAQPGRRRSSTPGVMHSPGTALLPSVFLGGEMLAGSGRVAASSARSRACGGWWLLLLARRVGSS